MLLTQHPRRICGEPSASPNQWAEIASEAVSTSTTSSWALLSEFVRVRLFAALNAESLARFSKLLNSSDHCEKSRSVTMAVTTRSHSTRGPGKVARCRRTRPVRYGGIDWGRAAGGPELQWATHTEFPTFFHPLTSAGGGSAQRGEVVVLLADGSAAVAHPSDSCPVVLIGIASDLEGQLDIISEVLEGSIRFSPDGRLPHTPHMG